jgi:hypothetical protein
MRPMAISSLLMFLFTATMTADTVIVTTSSPGVYYAVSDNGFYVQGTPIHDNNASAYISGSDFIVSASGSGYSDAGIVVGFTGGLDLNDLLGVTVYTNNPSAVNINIWLDTGGDGQFFQFDSHNMLTSLNNDSYTLCGNGGIIDPSVSCFREGTVTGSYNYTLAQLQNGDLTGISGTTGAALWIGVTNAGGNASISSVTIIEPSGSSSTPEPTTLVFVTAGALLICAGRILRTHKRGAV